TPTVTKNDPTDNITPVEIQKTDMNPPPFIPAFIADGAYKIEILITDNNQVEAGYGDNNFLKRDPVLSVDKMMGETQKRGVYYRDLKKDFSPNHPTPYFTEKDEAGKGMLKDMVSIKDRHENKGIRPDILQRIKSAFNTEFDERVQELRVSSGTDVVEPLFDKNSGNISRFLEEKEKSLITSENIKAKTESNEIEKHVAFNNAINKNTVQIKDDIQSDLKVQMVQKIEDIIEQYSEVKKNSEMFIRFKIDDGEILQVNMKNNGENILVNIKSSSSEIIGIFNNQKETIIKTLEEKNIFASIFVNPDGANNPEKRGYRQGNTRYKQGRETIDGFLEALEAQA
ncbi:MAG: hypothetical protein N3D15_08205, partial [Syntrophorhabdaceae bacterium]|nr:hypothetical protein [Syntrophorhabdaceae bacterium]